VAEASTGGLIAAALTSLAGSSAYFRGGLVVYDDRSKTEILGTPLDVFVEHGSVSEEACLAMAEAVRRLFQADLGLAETAIAGPGGATAAKPVGLSYVALSTASGSETRENRWSGDRATNRQASVEAALQLLAEYLG
jgi:PncC family amidohydrolase